LLSTLTLMGSRGWTPASEASIALVVGGKLKSHDDQWFCK
jgi:hypothetical protein